MSNANEVKTPTFMLRFVEREGRRILQQQWSVIAFVDGKEQSRTFEWHDIPLECE